MSCKFNIIIITVKHFIIVINIKVLTNFWIIDIYFWIFYDDFDLVSLCRPRFLNTIRINCSSATVWCLFYQSLFLIFVAMVIMVAMTMAVAMTFTSAMTMTYNVYCICLRNRFSCVKGGNFDSYEGIHRFSMMDNFSSYPIPLTVTPYIVFQIPLYIRGVRFLGKTIKWLVPYQ